MAHHDRSLPLFGFNEDEQSQRPQPPFHDMDINFDEDLDAQQVLEMLRAVDDDLHDPLMGGEVGGLSRRGGCNGGKGIRTTSGNVARLSGGSTLFPTPALPQNRSMAEKCFSRVLHDAHDFVVPAPPPARGLGAFEEGKDSIIFASQQTELVRIGSSSSGDYFRSVSSSSVACSNHLGGGQQPFSYPSSARGVSNGGTSSTGTGSGWKQDDDLLNMVTTICRGNEGGFKMASQPKQVQDSSSNNCYKAESLSLATVGSTDKIDSHPMTARRQIPLSSSMNNGDNNRSSSCKPSASDDDLLQMLCNKDNGDGSGSSKQQEQDFSNPYHRGKSLVTVTKQHHHKKIDSIPNYNEGKTVNSGSTGSAWKRNSSDDDLLQMLCKQGDDGGASGGRMAQLQQDSISNRYNTELKKLDNSSYDYSTEFKTTSKQQETLESTESETVTPNNNGGNIISNDLKKIIGDEDLLQMMCKQGGGAVTMPSKQNNATSRQRNNHGNKIHDTDMNHHCNNSVQVHRLDTPMDDDAWKESLLEADSLFNYKEAAFKSHWAEPQKSEDTTKSYLKSFAEDVHRIEDDVSWNKSVMGGGGDLYNPSKQQAVFETQTLTTEAARSSSAEIPSWDGVMSSLADLFPSEEGHEHGNDNHSQVEIKPTGVLSHPTHMGGGSGGATLIYEGKVADIYLDHNNIGIKVLKPSFLNQEHVSHLLNEQNVFNILPSSCGGSTRRIIEVRGYEGRPALRFQWVHGISLRDWIKEWKGQQPRGGTEGLFNERIRMAMAVAKALSEFHAGGAVHNQITSGHVIVEEHGGDYSATLIDLAQAVVVHQDRNHPSTTAGVDNGAMQADLRALGHVLNAVFTGDDNPDDGHEHPSLKKEGEDTEDGCFKRRQRGTKPSLGTELPIYLESMVSTLRLSGNQGKTTAEVYHAAKDVYLDLRVLLENPKHFLKPFNAVESKKGQLCLPAGAFYGRRVQISLIMHTFHSVVTLGGQSIMAMVSGYPGTGKSALVKQVKKPLQEKNGIFLEGKFDLRAPSDSVLASALDNFVGSLLTENDHTKQYLRKRIHDTMEGCGELVGTIPNLKLLMDAGFSDRPMRVGYIGGASDRLKHLFCKLIGAISSPSHPAVLFLDDLQWADETTLDTIRMAMLDPDIRHFLFLGSYRDNEVDASHPLTHKLSSLQEQGISITSIKLGEIEKECVSSLVSEALYLPPRLCRSLSLAIHSKTGGVILFVLKLLKSLSEEGLLWFSMISQRWEFDINTIQSKEISGDVAQYMTRRMTRLPKEMQGGLKLAACLGPSFTSRILERGKKGDEFDVDEFLEFAVNGGYIRNISPNKFRWAHDQVQQAAYELIPESRRDTLHLILGSRLYMKTPPDELDESLFLIVEHVNRGSKLITSSEQRYEVAGLNLKAGDKAIGLSTFHSAVRYLKAGVSLLDEEAFEKKYDLTMQLYDAATEALFVTGDFTTLTTIAERPLKFARCFEDKLNVYNNLVRSYFATRRIKEGMAMCIDILKHLNENVPTEVTADIYRAEMGAAARALAGKDENDLMNLPVATDPRVLAAQQFLHLLLNFSFISQPALLPILGARMVIMSIECGVCGISSIAFVAYGSWLVSDTVARYEEGSMMAKIALYLLSRLKAKEHLPKVYTAVYGLINIFKEPFQAIAIKHIEGFEQGMLVGDTETSISHLCQYSNNAIHCCGENLPELETKLRDFIKRGKQVGQDMCVSTLIPNHQIVLDLIGSDVQSSDIFRNGRTEQECYDDACENKEVFLCRNYSIKFKCIAFWRGDMDEAAAQMCDHRLKYESGVSFKFCHQLISIFIDGIIAFHFARKGEGNSAGFKNIGKSAIKLTKQWAEVCAWNFENKFQLLEAELHSLNGDNSFATKTFFASILSARNHKIIHEEGLACERLAAHLIRLGNHSEGLEYLMNAKQCYEQWGAQMVVKRIEREISTLSR